MSDKILNELLKRVQRFETRFTRYLRIQGFDAQIARPEWRHDHIEVPTLFTPLADIFEAIPYGEWEGRALVREEGVDVYYQGKKVCNVLFHDRPVFAARKEA